MAFSGLDLFTQIRCRHLPASLRHTVPHSEKRLVSGFLILLLNLEISAARNRFRTEFRPADTYCFGVLPEIVPNTYCFGSPDTPPDTISIRNSIWNTEMVSETAGFWAAETDADMIRFNNKINLNDPFFGVPVVPGGSAAMGRHDGGARTWRYGAPDLARSERYRADVARKVADDGDLCQIYDLAWSGMWANLWPQLATSARFWVGGYGQTAADLARGNFHWESYTKQYQVDLEFHIQSESRDFTGAWKVRKIMEGKGKGEWVKWKERGLGRHIQRWSVRRHAQSIPLPAMCGQPTTNHWSNTGDEPFAPETSTFPDEMVGMVQHNILPYAPLLALVDIAAPHPPPWPASRDGRTDPALPAPPSRLSPVATCPPVTDSSPANTLCLPSLTFTTHSLTARTPTNLTP
ncbi:hypothetical protein C8F04DRAFT_1199669 [Mycena alexandri]|uniref:Uncharacterized protein n=1 Tax=Mycena alexandri TaxID=1745969 RepID=A0AAD6RYQ5_9AGAR|nr:hypothetical protein C8F04DRAFT_1199669 [Mycena alexandri]